MAEIYQMAAFDSHTPIRCKIQTIEVEKPHRHEYFELDMVLQGTCNVVSDNVMFTLSADDVFSVDPHTTHEMRGSDCVMVTIQFEQSFFEKNLPHPLHPQFFCNSKLQGESEAFDALRRIIALIVKNNADQQLGYELRNLSLIYQLMDLFHNNFRVKRSEAQDVRNHRYSVRISEITRIIREHYSESLSLSALAEMVHLSAPYLSKFFDQQFGMTFLAYLTQYRLSRAVHELDNTSKTIEEISADNGFPNSHAFVQAFKKEYQMLPSVYRRMRKEPASQRTPMPQIESHDYMSGLRKYLVKDDRTPVMLQSISCSINLNADRAGNTLSHTWKNVLNVGSAYDLLISDVQNMVLRVQHEIGFKYLHFTGIFSDDLRVCSRMPNGKLAFNFAYTDKVIDFTLRAGLKPFIQLTYMPNALAEDSGRRLFNSIVSAPKDNGEWCLLIREYLKHLTAVYSPEEVKSWYFCIWNQPDTPEKLYGFGDDDRFFDFYLQSWQTIKEQNPEIRIALVPTFYMQGKDLRNWYLDFAERCRKAGCLPDVLSFTYYDMVLYTGKNQSRESFGFVETMQLSMDENSFSDFITQILSERKQLDLRDLPVYLLEWNSNPSQQDLLNDTCFKACYIVKNILQNYDRINSFGYWSLTDLMGEAPLPDREFFGGLGMFTKNGIPKATYFAFVMLNHLGRTFVDQGEGWFATRDGDSFKILVYNYRHYSNLYAMGEKFDMTFTDRYTVFEPMQSLDVHLKINGVENGTYMISEMVLNRANGSAFDLWVEMGALEPEGPEEYQTLKSKAVPMMQKYLQPVTNGCLEADAMLDMLEVRLITVRRAEDGFIPQICGHHRHHETNL